MEKENIQDKIKKILSQMTLQEKARILTGKDFWNTVGYEKYGIPSILLSDGPSGLRKQGEDADNLGISGSEEAVCYPPASCIACSFDKDLVREFGENLGEEGNFQGINVLLGPAINIQRSPLCGRNFEYFSEDPLLTGILATEYIKGVQSKGIGTCLKHYAVNSQEKMRFVSDSVVDDRALYEIYLRAFYLATKNAKPTSIMTSYNLVNGSHVAESKLLIQEFMRDKIHFKGAFVSDWGATDDIVKSIKNGLNLEMPGGELKSDEVLIQAIEKGELTENELDSRVYELLRFIFKVSDKETITDYKLDKHLKFAQKSLEESAVLLKNEGVLPLSKDEKVLFIGEFCKNPRYQGSGSCKVNIISADNVLEALKENNIHFEYSEGYSSNESADSQKLIEQAVEKAKIAEKVVIIVGYPEKTESEGYDRTTLSLPENQIKLINMVSRVNDNVIIVLNCGSPVSMEWQEDVRGIIYENFCGCQGGKALVNILYGKVNPSGKLNQSFPINIEDTPCYKTFATDNRKILYTESIYVGYRYYLTADKPVLYPFGYGLSYTEFDIKFVSSDNDKISVLVKNKGNYDGKYVLQAYRSFPESKVFRPKKELMYFEKISLNKGEEKIIEIHLNNEMFEFYNSEKRDYDVESGEYIVYIGDSSVNLPVEVKVNITGSEISKKAQSNYFNIQDNNFSEEDFRQIYSKEILPYEFKKPYTSNSTISELRKSFYGRIIERAAKKNKNTQNDMARNSFNDIPLRAVLMAGYDRKFLQGVVNLANGKIFSGLKGIKKSK